MDDINQVDLAVWKRMCESNHLFFTRYFFKPREGFKFRVNWHHHLIADTMQRVIDGEIKNVVINVPPGSSKTELTVINLIARGLALNPMARFLHVSYSDDLALLNSETAKAIIEGEEFQELWPMPIAVDAKSKKRWNIISNGRKAGGVYAVSLGGQITGFRAGRMADGFYGAILIDDPLKPDDANSKVKRKSANRSLINTVKSRKANPDTPIIIIMQRLAEDDPTGFIKQGGLGGKWDYINIPAIIDDGYVSRLSEKYQHLVDSSVRDDQGRFSYWEYKEPIEELVQMEKGLGESSDGQKMSRHVFSGQYMQNPAPEGGDIIKGEWFERYSILPRLKRVIITVDTAMKAKQHNDYSVFLIAGLGIDSGVYIIDLVRGKWEAPALESKARDTWAKHSDLYPQAMYIEDKASGTGLIQKIQLEKNIPVKAVQVEADKYTRVLGVQGYIESKYIYLPTNASWVSEFIAECEAFTADDSHAHDDQVDALVMAIKELKTGEVNILDIL